MDWRTVEAEVEGPVLGTEPIPATFAAAAERAGDRAAQRYKGGVYDRSLVTADVVDAAPDGGFASLSYADLREIVRRLAAGLRETGIEAGSRVGLFAGTRMEWAQVDLAALSTGAVVTTVYDSSSPSQVAYLLGDAGADTVVVGGADQLARVLAVEDDLDLSLIVSMDEYVDDLRARPTDAPGGAVDADAVAARDDVLTLGALHERGATAGNPDRYESWVAAREPGELASLIYTSGTTGRPKGVRLTHRNFRANVAQCYRRFGAHPERDDDETIGPGTTTLSFLPLAHVFERLAGHFLMLCAGATVAYAESPDTLQEDFGLVRPNVGTSVPRVYEKLYDTIRESAAESPLKRRLFEWAVDIGREHYAADDPGVVLRAERAVADRLVFSTVREALGGNIDFFISGGGSLSAELCELYHAIGLPVLEGYGLTETSPVVTVNPAQEPKVGTIGPPVSDTELRIDEGAGEPLGDDAGSDGDGENGADSSTVGELLVTGPQVTDGYWNRPAATSRAFTDDGWFRTGDVVALRPDGYVEFRERAKQILKLSTGKMVAPGPIEDAFTAERHVEQCMVVGDARKFVGALIVPDIDAVRGWADEEAVDLPESEAALLADDRVRELIGAAVDRVNEGLEKHERIKRFELVGEEFTEDNDLLTPTMKKKRRNVLERFDDAVEAIYADG